MAGHRLSDQEFIALLAMPEPRPQWDINDEGCFLLLPVAERDRAWIAECCREDIEGDYHVLGNGEAVLFQRERDFAFARVLTL